MLVRQNSAGAGFTADADEALAVQFVVWHLIGFDVIPDLCRCPIEQRIKFDQGMAFGGEGVVDLHFWYGLARFHALVTALSGNPGI